jgi:cell division protein FtsW (lipid II flippase)
MTAPSTGADQAPSTRRNSELALLLLAVVVVTAAVAIVDANTTSKVGINVAFYGAGFAILWLVAHLVVRRVAPYADPLLLPIAALLNGLGLVLIYRIRLATVTRTYPSADPKQQVVWMVVGLGFFVAVLVIVRIHQLLARYAYTLAASGLLLLVLPAVLPASISEVNGARAWIHVAGFSIQPGEFAKLALLVFFASYLVDKRDVLSLASHRFLGLTLPRGRDLGPVLVAWLLSVAVLARESDLGQSLLFFGMFIALLYIATERTSWLVIGLLLFSAGAYSAYRLFAHVRERVTIWLHPIQHYDQSYQLMQGLFGMGTGGVFGTGLGRHSYSLRTVRDARIPHRDDRGRLIRKALGRRPCRVNWPAGLRHRRRRHQAHPAHRSHHPFHLLRRIITGRQLRSYGTTPPNLPRHPPANNPQPSTTTAGPGNNRNHHPLTCHTRRRETSSPLTSWSALIHIDTRQARRPAVNSGPTGRRCQVGLR